jgi:hypothetical protein
MGDQPFVKPLPSHMKTQTWNKSTPTSIRRVGFKLTASVLVRVKTFNVLARGLYLALTNYTIQIFPYTQWVLISDILFSFWFCFIKSVQN